MYTGGVFDLVTAGKQLHEILTKHIPMAKDSPVTPITNCYFATGDQHCAAVVQPVAAGGHGQQKMAENITGFAGAPGLGISVCFSVAKQYSR